MVEIMVTNPKLIDVNRTWQCGAVPESDLQKVKIISSLVGPQLERWLVCVDLSASYPHNLGTRPSHLAAKSHSKS